MKTDSQLQAELQADASIAANGIGVVVRDGAE
jgi:hypothetical protein